MQHSYIEMTKVMHTDKQTKFLVCRGLEENVLYKKLKIFYKEPQLTAGIVRGLLKSSPISKSKYPATGIRPLMRGLREEAEATLEDARRPPVRAKSSHQRRQERCRAVPSVHKAACGGLFRIVADFCESVRSSTTI